MGNPSDVEPTVKFTDADLEAVWGKLQPDGVLLDEDEDEGATELVQMLDVEDLEALDPDTGVFSLEEPSVDTDPVLAARQRMPHASHTPAPAPRRRGAEPWAHPSLRWAMLAGGAAGAVCGALWWWLQL
jgi:hypothetical protein